MNIASLDLLDRKHLLKRSSAMDVSLKIAGASYDALVRYFRKT